MKRVTVLYGQNMNDLAIQEYGSTEGVFQLMKDNPTVITRLDMELVPGTMLFIKSAPVNDKVLQLFNNKGTQIGTWAGQTPPKKKGVGYWKIGIDFKVKTP